MSYYDCGAVLAAALKKEALKDTFLKADYGKPTPSLIPTSAVLAEAAVLAFGAKKYDRHNWRKGTTFSRYYDAALRHLLAWNDGEDLDPESGISHLAHARCCLGFLIEFQAKEFGEDDRLVTVRKDPP